MFFRVDYLFIIFTSFPLLIMCILHRDSSDAAEQDSHEWAFLCAACIRLIEAYLVSVNEFGGIKRRGLARLTSRALGSPWESFEKAGGGDPYLLSPKLSHSLL